MFRLLHLCRSIDLQRALRTLSSQGSKLFILLRRKNQTHYQWEEVMELPAAPQCCPRTLVLKYVAMTANCAAPGSDLLRSLVPPFASLSAKTVGSVTKTLLTDFGIPTKYFGPHSTRGAAVKMFKNFGLSSDQMAQLGQWKNLEAFSKHYLRLNSVQTAAATLDGFVHRKVSQGACAEPAWSRTSGAEQAP